MTYTINPFGKVHYFRLFPLFLTLLPFKMKIYILLIVLVILICSSCEKEYKFNEKLPNSKLVIYSFIEPDSIIEVYVSQTRGIGQSDEMGIAHQVTGELYVNDRLRTNLSLISDDRYTTGVKANKGDRIRLVVRAIHVKEVCAETTIPTAIPILSVDTQKLFSGNHSQLYIRIEEQEQRDKYYRFLFQERFKTITHNHTLDSTLYSEEIIYDQFNKDNEPLLTNQNNNIFPGDNNDANIFNIFTNRLFQGKSYTLNIGKTFYPSYEYPVCFIKEKEEATTKVLKDYLIQMCLLNKDSYLYLRSVAIARKSSAIFTDPVKVYSNVKNGTGIVGGFTKRSIHITAPLEKRDSMNIEYNPFYSYFTKAQE